MKRMGILAIAVATIALGVLLARGKAFMPWPKLTLGVPELPAVTLIYLAQDLGYFADEKVQVESRSFEMGRDALASAVAGEVDLAAAFSTPVLIQAAQGAKIKAITKLHTSQRGSAILGRRDRGITEAKDLLGKRVGVTPDTSSGFLLNLFFRSQGLDPTTVKVVDLGPTEMKSALDAGRVDAVSTWQPHLHDIRMALGDRAISFYSDIYSESSLLVGREEVVLARAEAIKRLLAALARAEKYFKENRRAAVEIVKKRFAGKTIPDDYWNDISPEMRLDHVLLMNLEYESEMLKRPPVSVVDFVNEIVFTSYLEAVNPEAVTIYPSSAMSPIRGATP